MGERPIVKRDAPEEFPELTYLCRWRYSPGMFCSVPVDRDQRFCGKHEVEDRERLAALRENMQTEANA